MPRTPEEAPSPFSRAVAEGIADAIEEAGVSQASAARMAGLSANYFNERMRFVKSFTLSDIDKIAAALRFNPSRFLLDVDARMRGVGAGSEGVEVDEIPILTPAELAQQDLDLAANRDPAPRAIDEPAADEDQGDDDADDAQGPRR